jgi:hypothetical protein
MSQTGWYNVRNVVFLVGDRNHSALLDHVNSEYSVLILRSYLMNRYVAAKTCYFGVGGGTKAFTSILAKDTSMSIETVDVVKQGTKLNKSRSRISM